ncbi:hypothetical protein RA27_14925 [Ruegeria sp. ANG-R]|nr:hypothetical protein RA27_14925 [Ruegeria sp. ANG-R]
MLLELEASEAAEFELKKTTCEFDRYQLEKMAEAGLIDVRDPAKVPVTFRPGAIYDHGLAKFHKPVTYKITWAGHDYLDSVRDKGIWEKTKRALVETGGSASLEVVKILAIGFAKTKLSKHTGVEF